MADSNSTESEKKTARAAYQKSYRDANRESASAYGATYRAANKESIKAQITEHYRKNAATYKAKAKKWVQENPARRYEIVDKWRAENPEVYLLARRRANAKHRDKNNAVSRAYRLKNPEKMRALNVEWRANNPYATAHHVGLRRTRKMQATPVWADLDAIKAIYKKSSELNKSGGVKWHVDHEIPLKHALVCGLHNEFNLRVIPAFENQSKRNKFDTFK